MKEYGYMCQRCSAWFNSRPEMIGHGCNSRFWEVEKTTADVSESAVLRADLARVTQERDEARAERDKALVEIGSLRSQVNAFYIGTPETRLLAALAERDEARALAEGTGVALKGAIEEGAALKAECELLRADAERYRWLRDHPESIPYQDEMGVWCVPYLVSNAGDHGGGVGEHRHESLDAAIDAAMS